MVGRCRWTGVVIEVSHVLQRDKQQNKMFLMAVRRRAICRGQLLRSDWMLVCLQMFSQEVLEVEKLCNKVLNFQSQPYLETWCCRGRPGKGVPSCGPVISSASYCTPGSLRLIRFPKSETTRPWGCDTMCKRDGEKQKEGERKREIKLSRQMGVIYIVGLWGQTKHVLGNFVKPPIPVLW